MNGGNERVAGSPSRIAATSTTRLRSTIALVKCVVPIITALTSAAATFVSASKSRRTVMIPEPTSGVVGVFRHPTTSIPFIKTASVFVPPDVDPDTHASLPWRNVELEFQAQSLVDRENLCRLRMPEDRDLRPRIVLRSPRLVLDFGDDRLSCDVDLVADERALVDLRVDDRRKARQAAAAVIVEQDVLRPYHKLYLLARAPALSAAEPRSMLPRRSRA